MVVSANERLQTVLPMLLTRQEGLTYHASARSPAEALPLATFDAPDVIVSDQPPTDAEDVLIWRSVCGRGPRLVLLTCYFDQRIALLSVLAGASGLVLVPENSLPEAISRVASGELLRSPELTARLDAIASGDMPNSLTGQELRLFGLIWEGRSDEAIGTVLGTTPGLVQAQIVRIAGKLS